MSEPILQPSSDQTSNSSIIDSSDSSQEKKEIMNKLQNKVTNLLFIRKNNEKLVKNQDNLKKYLERLEQYKKINSELQQKNNIFCDALGILYNSDLNSIKKSIQELKSKLLLINTIQNELNIPQNFSIDQSESILNSIRNLKNNDSDNNRFILKMLRILGISTSYSSFESSQNKEYPTTLLIEEIQKIKEETEKQKASINIFQTQQNEICQMLDINNSDENDQYTLHFRIKGAIKNIKNDLKEKTENEIINSPECKIKIGTPQIVKTAITDLQSSTNKIKKDLYESQQKLKNTTNQLQSIEKKNEIIFKKFNCSSIDEVSQNYEDLMKMMNASNPDILRRSIRQMQESYKLLQIQTVESNSKIQSLQTNNQTLNNQLMAIKDQLNSLKSKLNESEAKKNAYKDELKDLKLKMNSTKMELKSALSERNNLRGQLTDKDEEIISLKEILQTEKGNVKIKFDEMEGQILELKQQNRKSQQETESIRSDFQILQQNHDTIQQQYKMMKDEKQKMILELENDKSQIRNLNKEIEMKSDELANSKEKNQNLKQQNQSFQEEIDELTTEKSNLKRKINDLNNQINSIQSEKEQILDAEQKENLSLKSKISQLESLNSQQKSEIENLNQMKQNLLIKSNEYLKKLSQYDSQIDEYEQNIQKMKLKIDQLQKEISSTKLENESLKSQINSMKSEIESQRNENSELKQNIIQLQKENQAYNDDKNSVSSLRSENSEEFDSRISQIINENSILKRINEENNQIINEMTQNQNNYCKLLGINPNSSVSVIAESISDLLFDNKGMYSDNQNMKQQLASIETLLNIGESSNPGSIQNAINSLYDEIQEYEKEIERMNLELNNMKQSNQKMCQILNIMGSESLIDTISSIQATINQIKQILNISDDKIIDCIESLHESIQTLCDTLNIDPKDSWIDSILAMYEALQDAAELLGITNSNQLSDAIQKIITERDHVSSEMKQISEVIQKWKNDSNENTPTIVQSHESIISSLCNEMQTLKPEQLLTEVTDLINQNNQFCEHIEHLKSNEEQIFSLFGIESNQTKPIEKIREIVEHNNDEINKLKEVIKVLQKQNEEIQLDFDKVNTSLKDIQYQKDSLNQQVEEFQKQNENLNQKLSEINLEKSDLDNKVENLSQMNEELKQQNNNFEEETNNNSFFEKQISDICNLLQINQTEDQDSGKLISESIESLQKTKEDFNTFKLKVNKILKKNESNDDSNELSTDSLLEEIAKLNQIVVDLCSLYNINSSDLLIETAKKQNDLIQQISPLFEKFKSSNTDLHNDDEVQNWQRMIQESIKAKEINEKITNLLNVNDETEIIDTIKSMQSQLETIKSKDEANSQFIDQLCETLEIANDENKNQQIQNAVNKLKDNSTESQKVINQISKTFGCEVDYISNFAESICQSMKNIAQIFNINEENSGLFASIENQIKEMKEENESFSKKFNEDKLFALQFTNNLNISNEQDDDLVHVVITRFNDKNKELKQQNEVLKSNQQKNESLITDLQDKISIYKENNRKLFEKFDLLSRFENKNENEDDKNSIDSERSKFNEIFNKIDEFQQIKKEYQKSVKKNKELSTKMRSIELEIIRHANQIKESRRETNNIDDALKHMKNHEIQISKLREIVEIPDSQFSAVVDKVSQINEKLAHETAEKEKLKQEIKFSNKRIHDFEKNELEYKKLIDIQENKIDSLTEEMEKKEATIKKLNSSLNDIFKSFGDENIKSAGFAIDAIEDLKRKIAEITKELIELKGAATVDNAFEKMTENEKQQLKLIKKKIVEQTNQFNSVIMKLQSQLENKNQNKDEIVRILKDAEADNYRLLDLLDPPLSTSINNPNSHIHIGNEYSMNPFVKQNVDIFRKRRNNLNTASKDEFNKMLLNHKIATSENNLINQKKRIEINERKMAALNTEQRQRASNANYALSPSEIIAQRLKKGQTTLF